ncbi:MAG: alpha/beta fold hydrolase [Spirochaetales bacterium]|nr:alpha/beta fold hydrolase [Spirochaetales bacterium]
MENTQYKDTWFFSESPRRGVALVVHGLNTTPRAMDPVIRILLAQGIDVLNLGLSGHRGERNEMKYVTRDLWLAEIVAGFRKVRAYADTSGLPVIFTGFSLGGVVGLDALCTSGETLFDYAVLFSPAITLHWYSYCVKLSFIFGNSFVIPSKTPEAYRANNGTTVAAYTSLFSHIKHVTTSPCTSARIPCLCFIDPDDELVDSKALSRLIKKKQWSDWKVLLIKKDPFPAKNAYHHLIINPEATGETAWQMIESEISSFLNRIL